MRTLLLVLILSSLACETVTVVTDESTVTTCPQCPACDMVPCLRDRCPNGLRVVENRGENPALLVQCARADAGSP